MKFLLLCFCALAVACQQGRAVDTKLPAPDTIIAEEGAAPLKFELIQTEQAPFEMQNIAMVPMKPIFNWLGAEVSYDKGRITATKGEGQARQEIIITVGSAAATINGTEVALGIPPVTRFDTTFVPLRFVSEAFGAGVEFSPQSGVIILTLKDKKGGLIMPIEPMPTAGGNDARLDFASRHEHLAQQAGKRSDPWLAARHYYTALTAALFVLKQETQDNPVWEAWLLLEKMNDELEAGNFEESLYAVKNAVDRLKAARDPKYARCWSALTRAERERVFKEFDKREAQIPVELIHKCVVRPERSLALSSRIMGESVSLKLDDPTK